MSIRLYRVILPADDIDVAASFYSNLLGQTGQRVSPGRHYFTCGGVTLAIYNPAADGDHKNPQPNFDHIYFAVDDIETLYGRAVSLGGLSRDAGDGGLAMGQIATRPWGERSFYMQDPFGNPLCFVDSKTVFTGKPA